MDINPEETSFKMYSSDKEIVNRPPEIINAAEENPLPQKSRRKCEFVKTCFFKPISENCRKLT